MNSERPKMKNEEQTQSPKKTDSVSTPSLSSRLKIRKNHRTYLAPMAGHQWNPLRKLERNRPCPCLSGKKFKNCHLNLLPLTVTNADADKFREQMARPDLIFVTKEN